MRHNILWYNTYSSSSLLAAQSSGPAAAPDLQRAPELERHVQDLLAVHEEPAPGAPAPRTAFYHTAPPAHDCVCIV